MTTQRTAVEELAREHNEAAIAVLADIMTSPMAEDKDRIRAADSLLDRGNGKPLQAVIQIPVARAKRTLLASKSDDELMAIIDDAPLPTLLPRTIDVTPEVVQSAEASPLRETPALPDEFPAIDPLLL